MSKNITTWGYNIPKLAIETSNMVTSYLYASIETETSVQALRFYIDTTKLLVSRVIISLNSAGRTIYNASVLNFQSI